MAKRRIPSHTLHKASGQGRVNIQGKTYYTGSWGTPESQARYEQLIADKVLGQLDQVSAKTLNAVLVAFRPECERKYAGYRTWKPLIKFLRVNLGDMQIDKIEPHQLESLMQREADARKWSHRYVRDLLQKTRTIFKWARRKGLIRKDFSIDWITECEVMARRTKSKPPVADDVVDELLPHLPEKLADMVRVQRLIACRPGELLKMRYCDINRSQEPWTYTPESHKNTWREKDRVIYIGPKAREILSSYLLRCESDESVVFPTRYGGPYARDSYRELLKRHILKVKHPRWTPQQLRKAAATVIRKTADVETAASVLGQGSSVVTGNHYATNDADRAVKWIEKHG